MGNLQVDRVIQILLPFFQGLSGQSVYQVDTYIWDTIFFAKPDRTQACSRSWRRFRKLEVFLFETLYSHTDPVEG